MADFGTPGETSGYPFPRPFQPKTGGLANGKKSVIKGSKKSKPIVKGKQRTNSSKKRQ